MWTILAASLIALTALALAVKLLRTSSPQEQVQRRLKIVQQSEFAPSERESAADIRKTDRFSRYPWLNLVLERMDVCKPRVHHGCVQDGIRRTC